MASKSCSIIICACILYSMVAASPTGTISYIQDIQVSYEDGKWVCGGIKCPEKTYGCRIQRKTNSEDNHKLNAISTCFDDQKQDILSGANTFDLSNGRKIDIDIESYIGADSVYSCGYGLGGNENAHGILSPNGWDDLKKTAEENKKKVEDSNAV